MPSVNDTVEDQVDPYSEALLTEGAYWDNFIANRLLEHDEIPGSVDFRIFFSQFSYKHNWAPPCLDLLPLTFERRKSGIYWRKLPAFRSARAGPRLWVRLA